MVKKEPKKTKGSWFSIGLCILGILLVLLMQASYADAVLQRSKLSTLPQIAGFGFSVLYTIVILSIFALGIVFNLISVVASSHFKEFYARYPLLVKVDNFLDWALWWLVAIVGIGGFILQIAVTEIVFN